MFAIFITQQYNYDPNLNRQLLFMKYITLIIAITIKHLVYIVIEYNFFKKTTIIIMKIEIDSLDKGILNALQENSKTPYAELGEKLHASVGTIHARIKKMERLGIIQKMDIQINYALLGFDITCFIGIFLNRSSDYERVVKGLTKIPEITDLHYTTGSYSMFAKLILKDTNHLRAVLHDEIQRIDGVQRTETLLSLHQSLQRKMLLS